MNETPAPYTVPDTVRQKPKWIAVVGVIILVVIIAIAALAYLHPGAKRFATVSFVSMTLPIELRGSYALSTSDTKSVLYALNGFGYRVTGATDGHAVSAVPNELDPVFVVAASPGFRIVSKAQEYYASTSATALAVSPDGKRFSFTRVRGSERPFVPDPSAWETVMVQRASGDATSLGGGTASAFIDDTHLIRIMPAGVFSLDLATGVHTQLLNTVFTLPLLRLTQSPDRMLLAWLDADTKAIVVYRYGGSALEKVASLPSMRTFTLGNDALYELRVLPDSAAEVWKYELSTGSTPQKIYTFPAFLSVTELYI